jgi:hypothetical protein
MAELSVDQTRDRPASGRRLLLGALASTLLAQSLIWPIILRMYDASWPAASAIAAMGIAFAQLGLAAVLVILGTGSLAIRGLIAVLLYFGAAFLAFRAVRGEGISGWLAIMLLVIGVICAPLVIARLSGVAIVPAVTGPPARGSRQYTIWGLLVLTTVVAVLLGIGRHLRFPWVELGAIAVFGVVVAVIPGILAPLALSRLPWPTSIIAGASICPAAGALLTFTGFPPPRQPIELAAMCLIQGAVIVAACLVARASGYRLSVPWERRE